MTKSHFTVIFKATFAPYHVKCQKVVRGNRGKSAINVSNKQAIRSIKVLYKSVNSCQVLEKTRQRSHGKQSVCKDFDLSQSFFDPPLMFV